MNIAPTLAQQLLLVDEVTFYNYKFRLWEQENKLVEHSNEKNDLLCWKVITEISNILIILIYIYTLLVLDSTNLIRFNNFYSPILDQLMFYISNINNNINCYQIPILNTITFILRLQIAFFHYNFKFLLLKNLIF